MIVLNTPHNPVGKVFTRAEIEGIANIAKEFNLLVMSDEVVRIVNPSVSAQSDAILGAVRLFVVRRRGTCADCHSSRDVGEDGHSWLCGE
jgi:hypothetical protein